MEKVRNTLYLFWEPIAMLALGFVLMSISFTSPSYDWLLNIVGSLVLLAAAITAMIAVVRKL
ncbi:MAG: hypothetical protein JNL42_11490 [Anaerolineae bacterium]|nr:hypothetical protein [Anaerolineae bacterium]